MNIWTGYLAPNERVIWQSSSYMTFKVHENNMRLARVVQYFAPSFLVIFFAFRELPVLHVGFLLGLVALAVFCFPRFENQDKPWICFAITDKEAHYVTIGHVHEYVPWCDNPEVKVWHPWWSLGGLVRAPVSVKIVNNKGCPNSRTMRWAVASTEEKSLKKGLPTLAQTLVD
ncbi:hypothetical protein KL867_14595 [Ruegeria litorea]|uniref:Uncharacterized protein n=1 Tax=Falsiruegeria litorea TaxID=1280831 RepID=A0ABS5WT35_9RHOB|nr:hypothetical protein [Falsiruegeria litorea]MBT3142293.1 hypothetical protein [Falsiruegeria litorea]